MYNAFLFIAKYTFWLKTFKCTSTWQVINVEKVKVRYLLTVNAKFTRFQLDKLTPKSTYVTLT